MKKPPVIDLNDAVQHPGKHLDFELSTILEEEEDLDLLEPVTGRLDAVSTGNLLLITGEFKTSAVVECSRCLAPVQSDIAFHVDEQFPVEGVPSSGGGNTFAHVEAEEPYPLFHGNNLLYEELLRQNLLLALPQQVLCSEDCPGIPKADGDEVHGHPAFEKLRQISSQGEKTS